MFFSRSKSKLGVDIGTSSIKVVQLRTEGEKHILETYGIVNVGASAGPPAQHDAITETAQILKRLLTSSRITSNKVVASLPNNIVFVSMLDMPDLSDKELKGAIEWEARRYVPLPLEEVTLSWSVLRQPGAGQLKVLLTAVPTSVINNYLKMFKLARLVPEALEIEALALIRSLIGLRKESFIIVDIGARITSLNLVDKGFLRISRSLAVGGETVTNNIAQSLNINFTRAEQFKRDLGLSGHMGEVPQAMRPALDTLRSEVGGLINIYESNGGQIQEIVFTGNGSQLPGLTEFMNDLGPKITMGNPLKFISYDPRIEKNLAGVSASLSVALGLAMRE